MKENKTRKEKFLEAMEIPIELLSDISRVTMLGDELVYIENYKGKVLQLWRFHVEKKSN